MLGATWTAQSSRPSPYSRVPSSGSTIQTRLAFSRSGLSRSSSESTASSGRAAASASTMNALATRSDLFPCAWPANRPERLSVINISPAVSAICAASAASSSCTVIKQPFNNRLGCLFGCHLRRVDVDFGVLGRLIRAVDPGEVGKLARARLFIQALDVARLGLGQRRVDVHLDELAVRKHPPHHLALGPKRADRSEERRVGKERASTCRTRWSP